MLTLNLTTGETEKISILDLMGGAVKERTELVFRQVLENIADLNTDPKKARMLTVKLTFAADENREEIDVKASIECRLAPVTDVRTKLLFGSSNGQPVAVEQIKVLPGQLRFDSAAECC